ncbi:MAG: caspase family protein [Candidatus Paceibacterota bacterium]
MDFSLAIGLDDYINLTPPTPYAENDANVFDIVMGDVIEVQNRYKLLGDKATLRTVTRTIDIISAKLENDDRLFFFYAGHGENFDGTPHLSLYDSDDLSDSWISIEELFNKINCNCDRSLFFIDACESTKKLGSRKQSIDKFDVRDLKERSQNTQYCCVFSATSHKGVASIIPEEKHGIWSFYLLRALKGQAPRALVNETILTSNSLQNYLSHSVKKYSKSNPSQVKLQDAYKWGKETGEILIHEYPKSEVETYKTVPEDTSHRIAFVTKQKYSVKKLSGFKRGIHHVPSYHSDAAESFVANISTQEVEENIYEVSSSLREILDLRRRDFKVSIEAGSGNFTCPYCYYDCFIECNENDLSEAILTMRFQPIDIKKIFEHTERLDECFPKWFDFLLYDLPKAIDIGDLIDQFEDNYELAKKYNLDYPDDASHLTISIPGSDREITIRSNEVEINFWSTETVPSMIEGLKQIANRVAEITSNRMKLLN